MRQIYSGYPADMFCIGHGLGRDRHLRVSCPCGREEEFDAVEYVRSGQAGIKLADLSARLVCSCGRKEAKLGIYEGPPKRLSDLPEGYRVDPVVVGRRALAELGRRM